MSRHKGINFIIEQNASAEKMLALHCALLRLHCDLLRIPGVEFIPPDEYIFEKGSYDPEEVERIMKGHADGQTRRL